MQNGAVQYTDLDEDPQEMLAEKLQTFGARLSKLASEQAAAREQIEQRWLKDMRQFHGEYTEEEQSKLNNADGSKIYVNVTRNKTNGAEARLQDMLFPTDDKNWGIKTTPVPDLPPQPEPLMGPDGQPVPPEQIKAQIEADVKKKAEAMQDEIDDQLTETRYALKSRDVIHDAAQLGTGILKGPVIVGRTKRRWKTHPSGLSELSIVESLEPATERVDPWNFYPDMSARTIDEAEFILERRLMTKKQLREFAKLPGVIQEQLRELVRAGIKSNSHIAKDITNDIRAITGIDSVRDSNKFEIWEYHGPISKTELLQAMEGAGKEIDDDQIDELDDEVEAVVFFANNHVLKVVINPLDTDDRPYAVFNWEKDESSIFGFGVPYLMRNPQRVINAAWRMILDNAGASSSDIIIANRELVEPADKTWSATPGKKKLYFLKDKTRNVGDVFASFSIPNHQNELAAIFTMARQLADEETNLPLIAQGEQSSHVTKTSSGMAMLMNSANIVLRRAVKNWDDDITRPLITRYYDWNMQFSDDISIKGEFNIDARGSGALLVREKQQENLMIYANVSAGNPELMIRRDWKGLDEQIAKSLEVPHEKLTLPDEEVEQKRKAMSERQPDPEIELKQGEQRLKARQQELDAENKAQKLQVDLTISREKLAQEREIALIKLAFEKEVTVQDLAAKVQIELKKDQTNREKAAGEIMNKQTETHLKAQNLSQGHDTYG